MIEGFEYKHYKGGTYEVIGIALPYSRAAVEDFEMGEPYQVYDALTPDGMDLIEMNVWEKNSVMIADSELPQVIYRSFEDCDNERAYGDIWARAVNNFFSYIPILDDFEVKLIPRFTFFYDPPVKPMKEKELAEMF